MRNSSIRTLFSAALLVTAFAACSGGGSPAPAAAPAAAPASFAAPLKGVTVSAFFNKTHLAGIPVEMYTGKEVDSCPPFGQPCVKKVKGLDSGTTGSDGHVELKARFSGLEIVCVQGYYAKNYATIQECNKNFPNSVALQFAL